MKNGRTYIDHNDEDTREAYVARHSVTEDWDNYLSSGSLSYHILWSYTSLDKAKREYAKKFIIKLYKD